MKIPDAKLSKIKTKLWKVADERNWPTLSDSEKTSLYEEWIRDEEVGGVLSRYIEPTNIRVYIKDTIMKPYTMERIKDVEPIFKVLRLPLDTAVTQKYIKPHGRQLTDGRIVCWGLSRDWKTILFAVYERAFTASGATPFAAIILFPTGKCQQLKYRRMVEVAAEKLGIEKLIWYDGEI